MASGIQAACGPDPGVVRACLVTRERARLVAGRQDWDTVPVRRMHHVTAEGRRGAGLIDARSKAST